MAAPSFAQNKLLLYLIIIVGLAAGYLYHSQLSAGFEVPPPTFQASGKDDLAQFKEFKIDTSLFSNVSYTTLQIFGELPVNPGNPGRSSLFSR